VAKARNWTLREDREDYFCIVEEPVLTLDLGIRRGSGAVERLGRYRLDLRELSARGFVNARDDGRFTVQINHVRGREFSLGTRKGATTPLAPYRVT
jgi:hypothetical protein